MDIDKDVRIKALTTAIELYCPDVKAAMEWAENYCRFHPNNDERLCPCGSCDSVDECVG